MNEKKPGISKPLLYYALIVVIVMFLLNGLIFPLLTQQQIIEVGYSDFLEMLKDRKVTQVTLKDAQLLFQARSGKGEEILYKTGAWPDHALLDRLQEANIAYSATIPAGNASILSVLFSWILPLLVFIAVGRMIQSAASKQTGTMASFGKSSAKVYVQAQTGKRFVDVAGQDEAKEALIEIVDFLHNPGKYVAIGANLPKGVLLVGPPGTGKTLLAKAVAGEAKVPFFFISGSEFVEVFVGVGAVRVRDLFKQAAEKAPCIVFIDEIDAIGKKREGVGSVGGNDEREQTLNQLLSEMDGFDGNSGVILLGATNRPETLDKALLRPGRFDRRIPVELPDLAGREAILQVHGRSVRAEPSVDYHMIAKTTPGASGADLANLINEAALTAVRKGRHAVRQSDLEESVEVILAGHERKSAVLSPKERRTVAYHEIGHALVSAKLSDAAPVHKITIIPRTSGALGYILQTDADERFLTTREQALTRITTLVGGQAAEALMTGTITTGAANDIEQATQIARAMIARFGMSKQFGLVAFETASNRYMGNDTTLHCADVTAGRIDEEVIRLIADCYEKAMLILKENQKKLRELASVLFEHETISGEEFIRLLE